LRVAWFTPFRDGAIAEYSRGVLAEMIRLCESRVFCDGPPDRVPGGVSVTDIAAQPQSLAELASFDAVFYNLGNDVRQHAWIFDVARQHPGIVVLHAPSLHRFFVGYYVQHLRRPDLYISRMGDNYGLTGLRAAHRVLGPWFDPQSARLDDRDVARYTFTEEALRSATGAVVHSRWHAALARELWNGPVCEAWLPAQRPSAASVPTQEWSGAPDLRPITLMMLGPVEPRAHVVEVLELLAEDPALATRTRCLIAGPYDAADPYARALGALIAEPALAGKVRILGELPPPEIDRCARAADVFINLRHPEDESSLMWLMYQLPFGKPVIAYDDGSFVEIPHEVVAKVAHGDRAGLRATLWQLVDSAARRRATGTAARRFADGHRAREYTRALLRFARNDACALVAEPFALAGSRAIAERIAADVGSSLASLGAELTSPGVDAVVRESQSLLWPSELIGP
jgi:glycosyltransferase involved in cell wall biosynthesis